MDTPLSRGRIIAGLVGAVLGFGAVAVFFGPRAMGALAVLIAMTAVLGGMAIAAWQGALVSLRRRPDAQRLRFPLYVAILVGCVVAGFGVGLARSWEKTHGHDVPPWVGPVIIALGALAGFAAASGIFGAHLAADRARAVFQERERLRRIREARIARGEEPGQLSDAPAESGAGDVSLPAGQGGVSLPRPTNRGKA
ncbi:MAG TPA: hypothetical protein VMV18_05635 [bacterium]|nr:hypothetical protein [bacterium]